LDKEPKKYDGLTMQIGWGDMEYIEHFCRVTSWKRATWKIQKEMEG